MTNVLFLVSTLARVGPTNQLHGLIKNIDKNKFNVFILTLSPEGENSMSSLFEELGITISGLKLSRLQGFLRSRSEVEKFIQKNEIDVVHSSGIRADTIMSKIKLGGVKRIATLRNFPREDYPVKFGKIKGALMCIQHEKLISKMANPVACSQSLKKKLVTFNKNLTVVQNGVDTSRFDIASSKTNMKKKLGLDSDKKILIFCGSLIDRKRPVEMLKSFLNASDDSWQLLYLGDGPLKQELISLKNDQVLVLGSVNNANEYYQASDIFVSSSVSEGLPNCVLEAMACGLFCILSDIGPHLEILNGDPSVGESFRKDDHAHLCETLSRHMKNTYVDGKYIRNYLVNNFSARSMSEKYQTLYSEEKSE
jgi:glycosyltransferase involved in cell wall biosynthesis